MNRTGGAGLGAVWGVWLVGVCGGERGGTGGQVVMPWERRDPFSFLDCEAWSVSELPPQAELALEGTYTPHLG